MLRTLQSHIFKQNMIKMNTRYLWQWIDDTFNWQVFIIYMI